jgi:hypothetical protein
MLTLIKRIVAAAIVLAAVAAPSAAFARVIDPPSPGHTLPVEFAPAASGQAADRPAAASGHAADRPAATSSSSSFQWGDAGIGAGSLLVLIGLGGAAAAAYRRRTHPLAS